MDKYKIYFYIIIIKNQIFLLCLSFTEYLVAEENNAEQAGRLVKWIDTEP
jgi:hypothetical protein